MTYILNTARQQVLLHLTRHLLAVAVVQKMIVNHSFPAIACITYIHTYTL